MAHVILLLVACWAIFFFLPCVFAATTAKPDTRIETCCPPGHFLAIEDVQESRQDPEGVWSPEDSIDESGNHHSTLSDVKVREGPIYEAILTKSYLADKWYEWTAGVDGFNEGEELLRGKTGGQRLDRHQYISRVFCVPDKNDLPSIDGLSGSSLPSPPYFATDDQLWQGISVKIRVLAEDQVLQVEGLDKVF